LTGGINGTSYAYNNTTALVGFTTGYDRSSNKFFERALHAEERSSLYQPVNNDGSYAVGYDSANRLRQYQRGVLSSAIIPYRAGPGASISTPITLPGTDQTRTYGLDGLGNWKSTNWTLVGSGGSTTSTAEVRQNNYVNEITGIRDTTGGTATTTPFTYDHGNNTDGIQGNGNLTNDGLRTYQWDAFNRLIQVGKVSGSVADVAAYVYDALGRRIQKTIANLSGGNGGLTGDIPAGTTSYLYDGQQIVEERNNAAPTVWTRYYCWGPYIDELIGTATYNGTTMTPYRVASDLLYRSTALILAESNLIAEAYDTDAYGNTLCYSGPGTDGVWFTDDDVRTNNPINTTIFTGRQFDPETEIYYYRARYYAPTWGRFLSRDPIGTAGGINLYAYVGGSPTFFTDPSGTDAVLILDAAAVLAAIAIATILMAAALANELKKCKPKTPKCKPCIPPVGDIAYRVDMPPSPAHNKIETPHSHKYQMNQSPVMAGCICFWNEVSDDPLPGIYGPAISDAQGGGVEWD